MGNFQIRTDLALEARESIEETSGEIRGVRYEEQYDEARDITITRVMIDTKNGAKAMGKPIGTYITMEVPGMQEPDEDYHREISEELAEQLRTLIPGVRNEQAILVVGLGNREVTADALGPHVVDNLFITRHVVKEYGKAAYNVDKIHDAIAENKQISFRYFDMNVDKVKVYRKDGNLYKESPVALTWDDENYYLIAFDEKANHIKHYRVDKMQNVTVTENAREGKKIFDEMNKFVDYYILLEVEDELLNDAINNHGFRCTTSIEDLKDFNFYIVAVPTPVDENNRPNLTPLIKASETVGKVISKNDIVVYESTVYPGVTEEECLPIVEKVSGLKFNEDFYAGYSPERINPGDKEHTVEKIKKVTSGSTPEIADVVDYVYNSVLINGTHKASSIKVAEASKIIENSQRDVNIAFMNELSIIFNKMGIDTQSVLKAAGTKWNFLKFFPGLVGGHCIGVDPYYLTYKAEQLGYHSQVILAGRRINDDMGKYVAENVVKKLIAAGKNVKDAKVAILGFTFKENCPDTRNTKIIDIYNELNEYGIVPMVVDPVADAEEAKALYKIEFDSMDDIKDMDAIIVAVSHEEFLKYGKADFDKMFNPNNDKKVFLDIKGLYDRKTYETEDYSYWRL